MQEWDKGMAKQGNMKSDQRKDRRDETECDKCGQKCKTRGELKSEIR